MWFNIHIIVNDKFGANFTVSTIVPHWDQFYFKVNYIDCQHNRAAILTKTEKNCPKTKSLFKLALQNFSSTQWTTEKSDQRLTKFGSVSFALSITDASRTLILSSNLVIVAENAVFLSSSSCSDGCMVSIFLFFGVFFFLFLTYKDTLIFKLQAINNAARSILHFRAVHLASGT